MKRAIYVGKPRTGWTDLHYGMTGRLVERAVGFAPTFVPDGDEWVHAEVPEEDIYIPSEDATRHCPKP